MFALSVTEIQVHVQHKEPSYITYTKLIHSFFLHSLISMFTHSLIWLLIKIHFVSSLAHSITDFIPTCDEHEHKMFIH